jgi:O-antigen ligase
MKLDKAVNAYWTTKNQEILSCICVVLMIVGLFFARAFLSIGMIVFFLNALHPQKIRNNWLTFMRNRFAVLCAVFFAIYVLSGLWSTDKSNWFADVQVKLPFVVLPFAMLDFQVKKPEFIKAIVASLLLCSFAGMMYGFAYLFSSNHKSGEHIPSPLEGDYIRFTLIIVLSLLLVIYINAHKQLYALSKLQPRLQLVWSAVAILYIHVQAAKSGLVALYLLAGIFILHAIIRKKQAALMICGILVTVVIGGIVLSRLPSVQRQIDAFKFERKVWETNNTAAFNNSYSFVPRLISYEIAGSILKEHPLVGVGAGDLMPEIEYRYATQYPTIRKEGRILPHNQFICTALATGIPLGVLLIALVFVPLAPKKNRNIYAIATAAIMIFGMLIEPMLEVQFGVFVYLFFTLLWVKIPLSSSTANE